MKKLLKVESKELGRISSNLCIRFEFLGRSVMCFDLPIQAIKLTYSSPSKTTTSTVKPPPQYLHIFSKSCKSETSLRKASERDEVEYDAATVMMTQWKQGIFLWKFLARLVKV